MVSDETPPSNVLADSPRKFLAEMLGTFVLVLLGDGSVAQYVLLEPENRNVVTVALGFGIALTIGILISGNISGGHLNPAVTLAMAVVKKCSWRMVFLYWSAQYFGAFLGSAALLGVYSDAIIHKFGSYNATTSGGIFASYPNGEVYQSMSIVTLVYDQTLATCMLMIIIMAATDDKNMGRTLSKSGLAPLVIGFGLSAIIMALATNAGCAMNPARDLSPRILTFIAGFGESSFTSFDYFFWIPWLMPHFGSVAGALIYEFAISLHITDDGE